MPTQFLDALIAGDAYPFSYTFPPGVYEAIGTVSYRELPDDAVTRMADAIKQDAEALGLDSLACVIASLTPDSGTMKGEQFLAHAARVDAFTLMERVRYSAVLSRIQGALVASILGTWNANAAITAENCAKLPASVQRELLTLAQAATLSDDAKKN